MSTTATLVLRGDVLLPAESPHHQILILSEPEPPTLTIEEQPAQFYRYRYESEVEKDGNRVGGLLLGRNSGDGSKSFPKVGISGINPAVHSQLQLTVCTVSAEDKAPHPYYLHGDSCRDGYFELKKSVDSTFKGSKWDVSFNRLAIICVPKKSPKDIDRGMEMRRRNVPVLHDYIEKSEVKYDSRNLGKVRLAFSLVYTDTRNQSWYLPTLFSEEIAAEKEKKSIDVECLNPAEVPLRGGCLVAILTKTPTTGISKSDVSIQIRPSNEESNSVARHLVHFCSLKEMKKHLIIVQTPDLTTVTSNDRLRCRLTIHSNGFISQELDIVFFAGTAGRSSAEARNPLKRPLASGRVH